MLLDLGLPGGQGFAGLSRTRSHPELSGMPVIVVSSKDGKGGRPREGQPDAPFQGHAALRRGSGR